MAKLEIFFKTLGTKISTLWKTTAWFKIASIGGAVVIATSAVVIPNAVIRETGGIFHKCDFSVESIDAQYSYLEANCTEKAKYYYSCACGEKGTEFFEYGDALGHDLTHHASKQVTCTAIGYDEYDTCSRCDYSTYDEIPATGHTGGEWITDANATCTKDGSKHQVCSVCNDTVDTAVIPATGHTDGEWITDANATCTEDGSKHQICSVCSDTIDTAVIPATGHTDGDWITDANATCTEDGSKHQVCSICSITINKETIPKFHNYSSLVTAKNCISNAKISYVCEKCFDTYTEDVSIITMTATKTNITKYWDWYTNVTYSIQSSGGYGTHKYKFEIFKSTSSVIADFTYDFSCENTISFGIEQLGGWHIAGAVLQVTIKDEANNTVLYRILADDDSVIEKSVINENLHNFKAMDSIDYVNKYGFGQYKCTLCNYITYKDCDGNELELANLVLSNDKTTILSCNNINTAELLIIPNAVKFIEDDTLFAFDNNLKYVLFGENSIDLDLGNSSIKQIYIPANITVTLSNCSKLHTVIWGEGVSKIDQYGIYSGCVGRSMHNSSIQNIVIPTSVTLIKSSVFRNATQLSNVYYSGTPEQWNNIVIENEYNTYLIDATRYYYSENEPTDTEYNYWHYVDGVPTIWE